MKKILLSMLLLVCVVCTALFAGCDRGAGNSSGSEVEKIDYAGQVTLDMTSETQKQEVTVKIFVDGDTTHFNVPTSLVANGTLKARYLAVNTPESTGQIEEWGKTASKYTRSRLESATSILIETDGAEWEVDSTGERYLVWVWYKTEGSDVYRNLNIELLQEGLAVGSGAGTTRYGSTCTAAIAQATSLKLYVHSKDKDPEFYYGDALPLDLKELRTNVTYYTGKKVAFEGSVSYYSNNGVYVEDYDEESEMYYGMYIYYGFTKNTKLVEILTVGNRVKVVGNCQYYETGDSYQIADVTYDAREKDDPDNVQLLSKGTEKAANVKTTAETFKSNVSVDVNVYDEETGETEIETKSIPYAQAALATSVSMKNLVVKSMYTTNNGGDNDGAISITCEVDGKTIVVRTAVLKNEDGTLVTQETFAGKTLDVVGVIDYFDGEYQIKVFSLNNIEIH